jgi:hypothetical protein
MALLGRAALAMWWDMAPAMRDEFEEWHTREHFPQRLALPEGTMGRYELSLAVLGSDLRDRGC